MNLAEAVDKLTGATAKIENLAAEKNQAASDLVTAQATIADLQGKLASAPKPEAITEIQGKLDSEKARADKAEADLKAEKEAEVPKINAAAANIVAAAGHAPVSTIAASGDLAAKSKTLAEFRSLSVRDKASFLRSG